MVTDQYERVRCVPYNDETHRAQSFKMLLESGKWLNNEIKTRYGINFFLGGDVRKVAERVFPRFVAAKPPDGLFYILIVDSEVAGISRLSKLDEDIGEISNMYIRPKDRGNGYSYLLLERLEATARGFGFFKLLLSTAGFNVIAQNLYKKAGFKERERYSGIAFIENESTQLYIEDKVYMEKIL